MSTCIFRRIVPAVVVAAAVATLAIACSGGNTTTTSAPSPTVTPTSTATAVTLSGQVTDSTTATPISGATVSIADSVNAGKTTTTDGLGNYTIAGLQPAGFTVNAVANGYVSSSKGVTLTSNQTLLFPLTRVPISLTGAVMAASGGARISGATVTVLDGSNAGRTTTTTSGDYHLDNLTVGNANLSANAAGFDQTINGVFINGTNTLNFSLRATPTPIPIPPVSPSCNGQAVPAIVDCLNNQGLRPPTAKCNDGAYSCSQNRSGTCSSHSGVSCWVCPGPLC